MTSVTCPVRKYVLRMRNRKLRHIRPSGAFWPEVTKSRDRKRPWPEVCSALPRLFPAFFFLLVVVTWLPDVTEGHLTPFRVLLVCTCATGSCATSVVTEGQVTPLEVFSMTSVSYNHRKPSVLYLAWLLELVLVICPLLLAHLTLWASVVRPLIFHILINSSEATGPISTKLWWNGLWMAPFQNCVRWSWLPTKMGAKLKIEKRGDEILIVHCCFSISQNELKF